VKIFQFELQKLQKLDRFKESKNIFCLSFIVSDVPFGKLLLNRERAAGEFTHARVLGCIVFMYK
jgi:hypothetical protein